MGLGFALRRKFNFINMCQRALMPIIYLLLLVMGVVVGANREIMNNLSSIGLKALVITVGAVVGSLIAAKLCYRLVMTVQKQKIQK